MLVPWEGLYFTLLYSVLGIIKRNFKNVFVECFTAQCT